MGAFLESLLNLIVSGFIIGVFVASGMAGGFAVAAVFAFAAARVMVWLDERKM